MDEWKTVVGIALTGIAGLVAGVFARRKQQDALDDRFMERLMKRVEHLEEQNAKQAQQIATLNNDIERERQTVRELRREVEELRLKVKSQ